MPGRFSELKRKGIINICNLDYTVYRKICITGGIIIFKILPEGGIGGLFNVGTVIIQDWVVGMI